MVKKQNSIGKGYVQVYTGNGKGKTTAALGLAFRAMGNRLKTYIGQFMKGQYYSELEAVKMVSDYMVIEQYGKKSFIHIKNPPDAKDVQMAKVGLVKAKTAMLSHKYDIIILDEINTAHYFHLINLEDMLDLINDKPSGVELVFTGRYAPPELIEAADLVTEMKEIKHYYQKNVESREGIEK